MSNNWSTNIHVCSSVYLLVWLIIKICSLLTIDNKCLKTAACGSLMIGLYSTYWVGGQTGLVGGTALILCSYRWICQKFIGSQPSLTLWVAWSLCMILKWHYSRPARSAKYSNLSAIYSCICWIRLVFRKIQQTVMVLSAPGLFVGPSTYLNKQQSKLYISIIVELNAMDIRLVDLLTRYYYKLMQVHYWNCSDCGVFCLKMVDCLSSSFPLKQWTQTEIQEFRMKLAIEFMHGASYV